MVENPVETVENRVENWGNSPKLQFYRPKSGGNIPQHSTAAAKNRPAERPQAVEKAVLQAKTGAFSPRDVENSHERQPPSRYL